MENNSKTTSATPRIDAHRFGKLERAYENGQAVRFTYKCKDGTYRTRRGKIVLLLPHILKIADYAHAGSGNAIRTVALERILGSVSYIK